MRNAFFTFLFFSLSMCATGQRIPRTHRHVPFFYTFSPKALSKQLTRGLDGDSAKVGAIHSWMTYHIRYDVKRALKYDLRQQPVKKTLRTRKAICTGYADLFTELCKHAGVRAVKVAGYTKNIDVDIVDTFYLDDHMWNEVMINGQWRPIDVTWDAGYVADYITFNFLGLVTVIYKPHFVRDPTDRYYLIASDIFVWDHLPANPNWQLMSPPVSIGEWARDSSFYYKMRWVDGRYDSHRHDESYGLRYLGMTEDDKIIEDGQQTYAYNRNNQLHIAEAWQVKARQVSNEMKRGIIDTAHEIALCDTVIRRTGYAIAHDDSNTLLIRKEQAERSAWNDQKKTIFNSYINQMKSETRRIIIRLASCEKRSKAVIRSCSKAISVNNKRMGKVAGDISFYGIRSAHQTRRADSAEAMQKIILWQDSLKKAQTLLQWDNASVDSLYAQEAEGSEVYAREQRISRSKAIDMSFTRINMFDDLDNEIRKSLSELQSQKAKADTSLFLNHSLLADTIYTVMRKYRLDSKDQYLLSRSMAGDIKKLKTANVDPAEAERLYRANTDTLLKRLTLSNALLTEWQKRAHGIRIYAKYQRRQTRKEWKALSFNKYVEYMNWRIRQRQINRKATAYIRPGNGQKAYALMLQRKAERYKKRLTHQ
ncbi:MAG: ky [Bacteroidetes bacterium]|nr:ky [Bacteroidota bacterium]